MKEALKSYFSFHRSQRLGLLILMSLILMLLLMLTIMHQPVAPDAGEHDNYQTALAKPAFQL